MKIDSPSHLWGEGGGEEADTDHVHGNVSKQGEGYRNVLGALVIGEIRQNRLVDRGKVGSGIICLLFSLWCFPSISLWLLITAYCLLPTIS